jgi:hypothetical protein
MSADEDSASAFFANCRARAGARERFALKKPGRDWVATFG